MKILYVTGLSYVGSTYLSRVLNNHSDVFATGEIQNYSQSLKSGKDDCGCLDGTENENCPFWRGIENKLEKEGFSPSEVDRLEADRRKNWFSALASQFTFWDVDRYLEGNKVLFQFISDRTGKNIIIDNSKSPWRLLPLLNDKTLADSIKILHMIKSPEIQLSSRVKRGMNFLHSAMLKYGRKNAVISKLFSGYDSYRYMRFEKFVRNPERGIKRIQNWLELNREPLFDLDPSVEFHHLRGNLDTREQDSLKPQSEKVFKDHDWSRWQKSVLFLLRKSLYGDMDQKLIKN